MEQGLTFGQRAVGKSFNPSNNPEVDTFKDQAAAFIDSCDTSRNYAEDGEAKAMYTLAIRKAQEAQMWAVKAATWGSN